jgi:hypothetical protein
MFMYKVRLIIWRTNYTRNKIKAKNINYTLYLIGDHNY